MLFSLSVPSKTFLLGEYIALSGGSTLILNTEPRFQLQVNYKKSSRKVTCRGISTESPAGKFIAHYAHQLRGYELVFIDPHKGLGGFGASGAQFGLMAMLSRILEKKTMLPSLKKPAFLNEDILKSYQTFAQNDKKIIPSGVDIITQLQGKLTQFYRKKNKLQSWDWPFDDASFCLIRTGNKVATHLHLKSLTNANYRQWNKIALAGVQSVKKKDSIAFAKNIHDYSAAMQQQNLVLPYTVDLLKQLKTCREVLAAKGCGALGADVIFVLLAKDHDRYFKTWARRKNLDIVCLGNELSGGIQIEMKPYYKEKTLTRNNF